MSGWTSAAGIATASAISSAFRCQRARRVAQETERVDGRDRERRRDVGRDGHVRDLVEHERARHRDEGIDVREGHFAVRVVPRRSRAARSSTHWR